VAGAEPTPWISVHTSQSCEIAASSVEQRVSQALIGERAAELEASVDIEENSSGYEVRLSVARGGAVIGSSVITAPTCDEALDASVLALAFALGGQSNRAETASEQRDTPPDPQTRFPLEWIPPPAEPFEDDRSRAVTRASARDVRLSLMTGLDAGTFPQATGYVAAGMAVLWDALELRGGLRYGVPYVEESEQSGRSASVRRDFGALDLGACYGFGDLWRLSSCAGAELGVLRETQRLRSAAGDELDTDVAAPRLSAVLRALIAHRGGLIHPELELSGLAAAIGRSNDSPWLAVRIAAGAAVQF